MERELDALVASVADEALRALLRSAASGARPRLGRSSACTPPPSEPPRLPVRPAGALALRRRGCDRLAGHYAEQGFEVDRDLLVTGALLHDIGKLRELKALPANGYTTRASCSATSCSASRSWSARRSETVPGPPDDRLLLLQHLIASHQGKPEWDSPKVPQLLEALILHYADDLDAKLNQAAVRPLPGAPRSGRPGRRDPRRRRRPRLSRYAPRERDAPRAAAGRPAPRPRRARTRSRAPTSAARSRGR
jgi:3'-5' exoribonuclease